VTADKTSKMQTQRWAEEEVTPGALHTVIHEEAGVWRATDSTIRIGNQGREERKHGQPPDHCQ
jgi:hypothetical protein